jgi:hypothetical protein
MHKQVRIDLTTPATSLLACTAEGAHLHLLLVVWV